MNNNKKLIILIVVLLVIKLIVMPQVEQQNDNLLEKQQLLSSNKKLALMLSTVEEQKIQAEELATQLNKMQQLIPGYASTSQAKLAIQQKVEQYASQVGLVIERLNWQETKEDENLKGLMHGKIELSVTGKLFDIIKFQNLLADNQPAIIIVSLLNTLSAKKALTVKTRINLAVLFQQGQYNG
ncbi:MAG: hypothetical protein ACPG46_01655 [Thalassotalea sp.]